MYLYLLHLTWTKKKGRAEEGSERPDKTSLVTFFPETWEIHDRLYLSSLCPSLLVCERKTNLWASIYVNRGAGQLDTEPFCQISFFSISKKNNRMRAPTFFPPFIFTLLLLYTITSLYLIPTYYLYKYCMYYAVHPTWLRAYWRSFHSVRCVISQVWLYEYTVHKNKYHTKVPIPFVWSWFMRCTVVTT